MAQDYIQHLKALLETGQMTQADLAGRLGITPAALSRWLHGHAIPYRWRIEAIRKLHRELIGYPALDSRAIEKLVRHARSFRHRGIWNVIAKSEALQEDLLLALTYNSTAIEGTTFTQRQTEAVIFHRRVIPEKSYIEHLEVTNHAAILRDILGRRIEPPITEKLVLEMHRRLLQGIREDAGYYSTHHRGIRGVDIVLTHPEDIPEEMEELLQSWNRRAGNNIRDIADFHARFELIHPFGDGNGRIGRLLMTLQCLQNDFPPIIVETARKSDYYDALEYAQRKADGPLIAFLVEEMEKTVTVVRRYL